MANVYSAIYGDSNYWDGTTEWGYDATSDRHSPTPHVDQSARDAQYTAAYTSMNAWEFARDGASQVGDTEYAIIQTPWDSDDTTGTSIGGWSSDAIIIRAIGDARQSGVWEDGAGAPFRWVLGDGGSLVTVAEDNVTIDGLQAHNTVVDDNGNNVIFFSSVTGGTVSNCILNCANSGGVGINFGTGTIDAWNNVIYCPHEQGGTSEGLIITCTVARIFNNTVNNFNDGIEIESASTSCTIKNNISFGNNDDFDDAASSTIDYNASDDGDGTNSQAPDGADWVNEMSGYASNDYELDTAGNCFDNGTDDPGSGLYSDDITGTARTSTWSIGAFEFDSGAPPALNVVPLLMHQAVMRRAS